MEEKVPKLKKPILKLGQGKTLKTQGKTYTDKSITQEFAWNLLKLNPGNVAHFENKEEIKNYLNSK